jgi:5'-3' exonuclease
VAVAATHTFNARSGGRCDLWSTLVAMKVHLVDGTYELFRQHFGAAGKHRDPSPFAATLGALTSTLVLLEEGATHVAVATDHEIESFRNDLYHGYKTGEGLPEEILHQIPLLEEALTALGVTVWPMGRYEADDGLAAGAAVAAADPRVTQVVLVTPDKDLAQCVVGNRVVQYDRRTGVTTDHDGVIAKFGVPPASIPDYLALVGDTADGFPGLPGWGATSTSTVLARWGHVDLIPADPNAWDVKVRGAAKLSATLNEQLDLALLFRDVATVRTEVSDDVAIGTVDDWRWAGPSTAFERLAHDLGAPRLMQRALRAAAG